MPILSVTLSDEVSEEKDALMTAFLNLSAMFIAPLLSVRTDSKGAMNIAERLRKAVMSASFSSDTSSLKVTLSIGIATTPSDAKTKEELIEKADEALYFAKHNGRNRSVLWSEIKN